MEDYQAMMKKNYKFSQRRKIQDTFMDPNMVHTNVNGMILWLIGDKTSLVDRLVSFIIWQVIKYREICFKYNQYLKKLYFHM